MTADEYQRTTLKQMSAKRWRTIRQLRNGFYTVPAGSEVIIYGKINGLKITTGKCAHCGVQSHFTRVPFDAVEEITE